MEKIAFIFPGQGSQYIGMSKTLYEQHDIVRHTFEEASDILGFNLAELCFSGSLAELSRLENALVALLTSSVAAFRAYMKEIGVAPQFCAGHSLGEYSALTCSGALKFSDAVKIVEQRAKLAKEVADIGNSAMTIIGGITPPLVEEECRKVSAPENEVCVSCYNSYNEVAIAGHIEAVQQVENRVLDMDGQITPLLGTAPFHSPLMQSAAAKLKRVLETYTYSYCSWATFSNVTALPYNHSKMIVDSLANQIIKPVRWQETIQSLQKYGVTITIEFGAKNVLSNLVKTEAPNIKTFCYDQKADRQMLTEILYSNEMYSKHVPTVITKCLAIGVATPNYNSDAEEYKKGMIGPYRTIQHIQEEVEKSGLKPTKENMIQSIEMLHSIFNTKKIPVEEQEVWFNRIENETGTNYFFMK